LWNSKGTQWSKKFNIAEFNIAEFNIAEFNSAEFNIAENLVLRKNLYIRRTSILRRDTLGAHIRSEAGMLLDIIGLDLQIVPVRVHISIRYEVIELAVI